MHGAVRCSGFFWGQRFRQLGTIKLQLPFGGGIYTSVRWQSQSKRHTGPGPRPWKFWNCQWKVVSYAVLYQLFKVFAFLQSHQDFCGFIPSNSNKGHLCPNDLPTVGLISYLDLFPRYRRCTHSQKTRVAPRNWCFKDCMLSFWGLVPFLLFFSLSKLRGKRWVLLYPNCSSTNSHPFPRSGASKEAMEQAPMGWVGMWFSRFPWGLKRLLWSGVKGSLPLRV